MEELYQLHAGWLRQFSASFTRHLDIDWNDRLIGITGARGVGKTTFLLQRIKEQYRDSKTALYINLEELLLSSRTLISAAEEFHKRNGKYLFLDEIHKYPLWSQELKLMYDRYRDLHIVFTGSSILDIFKGKADLSRRAVMYNMEGLSFREFLNIETGKKFDSYPLAEVIRHHEKICRDIIGKVKPIAWFDDYLRYGYYPFYLENKKTYSKKLLSTVNLILEIDIPFLCNVDLKYVHKLKKLLYMLSVSTPYQPNIAKLSADLETSRNTVMIYLKYLEEGKLVNLLMTPSKGDAIMAKPEKVYLHNPNLAAAITPLHPDIGTMRETFFFNQLSSMHTVKAATEGDFIVDEKLTFEIGGRSKKQQQLRKIKNAFIVQDNIEYGFENKIPLWLFGFLY